MKLQAPAEPEKSDADKLNLKLAELFKMSDAEYELCRKDVAKEYDVRPDFLDKQRKSSAAGDGDDSQGRAIELYEPDLWPEPVDGADVLSEAARLIQRHMVMRKEDITVSVLWAVHTHIFTSFTHSPRLMIDAPDAECGKTMLMTHMVGNLVNRPYNCEGVGVAPFFRLVTAYKPSFLIDEADAFLKADADLLYAVNGGWEPQGSVPRCVGDQHEVRTFSTFAPVVLAGVTLNKVLPNTTISRSIVIHLERASLEEVEGITPYDSRTHKRDFLQVGRKIARWCADNEALVAAQRPDLPESVRNRLAEKWEPLFAIANVAGGDWPTLTHKALMSRHDISEKSRAVELLEDIRECFFDGEDRIRTGLLIERLCLLNESQWIDYNFKAGRPEDRRIKDKQIARILSPYGIKPTQFKVNGAKTRGYRCEHFLKTWERYAHTPSSDPVPRYSPSPATVPARSEPVPPYSRVPDRKPRKPSNHGGGTGVPLKKGGSPGNGESEGVALSPMSGHRKKQVRI